MNKEELQTIVSKTQTEYANAKKELAQIKRKEYLLANKERIASQKKIWHQNHSNLLTIRNKEYYERNKKKSTIPQPLKFNVRVAKPSHSDIRGRTSRPKDIS